MTLNPVCSTPEPFWRQRGKSTQKTLTLAFSKYEKYGKHWQWGR